ITCRVRTTASSDRILTPNISRTAGHPAVLRLYGCGREISGMLQDEQWPLVSRFVLSQLPLEVRELRLGGRFIARAVHPDFQRRIIGVSLAGRVFQGLGHLRQLALCQ